MIRNYVKTQSVLLNILLTLWIGSACAALSIDNMLIHRDAKHVQVTSTSNSTRQITYSVDLKYPMTALTTADLEKLSNAGWTKCSGKQKGWQSYVDDTKGKNQERTVFQNISYWQKGVTLLTILMKYDAGVTVDKRRLGEPDNTQQFVLLLEDKNANTKEWLGITCN